MYFYTEWYRFFSFQENGRARHIMRNLKMYLRGLVLLTSLAGAIKTWLASRYLQRSPDKQTMHIFCLFKKPEKHTIYV